jgi:hypothetical protein
MQHHIKYIFVGSAIVALLGVPAAQNAKAAPPELAPCCLRSTAVTYTEIDLAWSPMGVPNSPVTGYVVERGSLSGGFATIAANVTAASYADTNLASNATYSYRVSAINSDGVSAPSAPLSVTTALAPSVAVSSAPVLTVVPISAFEIDLAWTVPTSASAISGYKIERGSSPNNFLTIIASTTATTYADTNLAPGAAYYYRVSATNTYGPGDTSPVAGATTFLPPGPPRSVSAVPGSGQITVSWLPPYFTGGRVTTYIITRYDALGTLSSSTSVSSTVTSTIITGLTNGVTYNFGVAAANPAGTSSVAMTSTIVPATTTVVQAQPPAATSTMTTPAPVGTPAAAAPAFIFTSTLKKGMQNEAVRQLQQRLIKEGVYTGPVTGYFGVLTEAAVKAYQRAQGFETVGMLGPLTRARLNTGR